MLRKLAEVSVSVPQIGELTAEIGRELSEQLQQQADAHAHKTLAPQHAEAPRLVAVSVDGGRIMTRADAGRGVHDQAWKETKNACLPVSSSAIESRIKEINDRVKGTEKFWNRPDGAEHILQVRAAALSDDDKLSAWILNRPGSCFHRASTQKQHSLAAAA